MKTILNLFLKLLTYILSKSLSSFNSPLPSNELTEFFIQKIYKMQSNIRTVELSIILPIENSSQFSFISPTFGVEVKEIISSSNKTFPPADIYLSKLVHLVLPCVLSLIVAHSSASFFLVWLFTLELAFSSVIHP